MGVTLSTQTTVSPLSLASTVTGFISFAFTIATFLRVTWENYTTITAAAHQIPDYLGSLKQGLYEERAHLRRVRRHQRRRGSYGPAVRGHGAYNGAYGSSGNEGGLASGSERGRRGEKRDGAWSRRGYTEKDLHDEDTSTRVMREAVRNMIREFRVLERPFLRDDDGARFRDAHVRNGEGYAQSDDDEYYRTEYRNCGLRERWLWLRRKGDVVGLLQGLSRLETRRIAKEIGEANLIVRNMERDFRDLDDRVWGMEQRLSRVVGIRRVD